MIVKTITYTDYDGKERTEDFYFAMNEAEFTKMRFSYSGGMDKYLEKIIKAENNKEIVEVFEDLISLSYGEKSPDGRRFIKSPEMSAQFKQTPAYAKLFVELLSDDVAAAEFVTGIMPSDMATEVRKSLSASKNPGIKAVQKELPFEQHTHD